MPPAPHIVFAGGGAAGHFYPGMAVAAHLAELSPDAAITFAGPGGAREKNLVKQAGYQYLTIPAQPLPQNPVQALRFVTDNVAGYCAAKWILNEQKVSLVVGLGGYTSTALIRAASVAGVPFVLLEQNAIPSRTSRWFSRGASQVCAAFEEVCPHLDMQAPVNITGIPVRRPFETLYQKLQKEPSSSARQSNSDNVGKLEPQQKRLVILGGASGARSLNESMAQALFPLKEHLADWQIVHQTGEGQLQETEAQYRKTGIEALTVTYIDEIASVLCSSDLVVCRSGGMTLAELALAAIPAILVPFPGASDDHQFANARVFAAAGACRVIDESSQRNSLHLALARELKPLLVDRELRETMAGNIHGMAKPQAAADIASIVYRSLYGQSARSLAA